jgi:predicted alpha/beta-hydrolase family hydrolase
MELDTPHGAARVHEHRVASPMGTLVLGHGAGGGVGARDLVAATQAANQEGFDVILVEQPYRVAGRRSPAPAPQLDAAWIAVVQQIEATKPLIVGGRSSGARVACRTAQAVNAAGVLCLAFPLHPPGRPEKSRAAELNGVKLPTLVVQGESDPFGMPRQAKNRKVARLKGNHSLASDLPGLRNLVAAFLVSVT